MICVSSRAAHYLRQAAFLPLFILLFAAPGLSAGFSGKLVKVVDGDTVEVLREGRAERIRLHGIDAPESGQDYGRKAKEFILDVAAGRTVRVEVLDTDRYGRTVGEIFLLDGRSLNRLLVREGLAWWYRRYSNDASLGALEEEARRARRGLWADPRPVPPWEWRRGKGEAPSRRAEPAQQSWTDAACGEKRTCAEMTSCAEAMFHLRVCGLTRLDGNGDGVPCEALCRSL